MKHAAIAVALALLALPTSAEAQRYRPIQTGRYQVPPEVPRGADCRARCAAWSAAACGGMTAAICAIGSVITLGGLAIPCAVAGAVACGGAAGVGVYCAEACKP